MGGVVNPLPLSSHRTQNMAKSQTPNPAQIKLIRATFVLRCALADLEGFVDKHDPDGDHPARETIVDIQAFLKGRENDEFSS
jgi:hypothetical protein